MKSLFLAVLLICAVSVGCLGIQPAGPEENVTVTGPVFNFTPSGCAYGNPSCDEDHTCMGNRCVETQLLSSLSNHSSMLASDSDTLDSLADQGSTILADYDTDISAVMQTYTISPKEDGFVNFQMKKGFSINGTIYVTGGSDNDVFFTLYGSDKTIYINKTKIASSYQLGFTAPKEDKYVFEFGNMFTSFDIKTVRFDMLGGKYWYFQRYLSWSKNLSIQSDRIAGDLDSFQGFIFSKGNDLRDAGVDTEGLNDSISKQKLRMKQEINNAKENIKNMGSYFQGKEALAQKEKQESANRISELDRILQELG